MHLSVFTRSSPAWSYTRGRSPSAWGQSGPGHPGCQTPRGRSDGRRGGGRRDRRPGRRHCSCGVIRPWPEPRGRRGRGERRAGDTHSGQSRAWREQSVSYKYYKWTMGLLRHTGPHWDPICNDGGHDDQNETEISVNYMLGRDIKIDWSKETALFISSIYRHIGRPSYRPADTQIGWGSGIQLSHC